MANPHEQKWKRLERAYKRRIRDLENALRNARLCGAHTKSGSVLCADCLQSIDSVLRLARPAEETSGDTRVD